MATPNDRENRRMANVAPIANDPFFGATRKDVTVNGVTYKGAIDIGTARPPAATEVGMVSPISGLKITGTERNMDKERQAMNIGYTKEYIASRGGINSMGYFNDTPLSGQLNASEYKSVTKPDGTIDTAAMARILQEKQIAELVSQGMTKEEATKKVSSQFGQFGIGGVGSMSGAVGSGNAVGGGTVGTGTTVGANFPITSLVPGTNTLALGTPEQVAARKSAYDLLYEQFNQYGLGSLVTPLKDLILQNVSPSEFTLRLRDTDAYKKRFAANQARIQKGLRALSEAEYLTMEDSYQNIMRRYGLPESYYSRGDMGRQEGFEKFIAGDVSSSELEDRIMTAQNRVINGPAQVSAALRQYFPEITNGDILAYVLDPENSIGTIKRKVAISEIGGAAFENALKMDVTRASELAKYGITGQGYREVAPRISQTATRGGQLSEFYKQEPISQTTAEAAILGAGNSAAALEALNRVSQLERASFSGQAGLTGGALSRERAGLI